MTYDDLLKMAQHGNDASMPFLEDVQEIQRIITEYFKVSITLQECRDLWIRYSAKQDAQWLSVRACTSGEIVVAGKQWARSFFKQPMFSSS